MTSFGRTISLDELRELAERYRSWGTWGPEDELGHMNYVGPDAIVRAAGLVKKGKVFSMALPLDEDGPMTGHLGRTNPEHRMLRDGRDIGKAIEEQTQQWGDFDYADDAVSMILQSSTQWDAFSHVFWEGKMYNGFSYESVDERGAQHGAITNVKDRMVGRGVLLDVPRLTGRPWLEPAEAIEAEDLEACCEAQGVDVGEGDFVVVRTGRLGAVRERGAWGDEYAGGPAPGLGITSAAFLVPRRVAAVATDTFGAEVQPSATVADNLFVPLHVILTVSAGIHLGEMWDVEELAADCAQDGVWDFLLVAPPLTFSRAVGSPVNPLAVK